MKLCLCLWLVLISHVAFSQGNAWSPRASFDGPARHGAIAFTIGNKIYAGTGSDATLDGMSDFWEYNPNSNEWTQKNDFAGAPRFGAVGFSIGGKGYIALGSSDQGETFFNDVWEYDPSGDEWTQVANFPGAARTGAVVFVKANKAYIGTGRGTEGVNNDFWEFSANSNEWVQVASLPGVARQSASAFCIGSSGYVGTGSDASGNPLNDFWEYNPQQNEWTQKSNFGGLARSGAVGFCIGGIGFIGTGTNEAYLNDVWAYDPATNLWQQIPDFAGAARAGAIAESQGSNAYVGTGTSGTATQDFYRLELKTPQTITFGALPSKTFGDAAFSLTATTSSALPVSYQSSDTGVATISGSTVTIVGTGSTTITASQSGNGSTYAATSVSRVLVVAKANQTITFNALQTKSFADPDFQLSATATSGLPVTFQSSNTAVATISGSTVTIIGAGAATITASQPGNQNVFAAPSIEQVLTIAKADQTITFGALPEKAVGDTPFPLTATSSSGLAVTYESSNTLVATINGSTITIVGGGTATITATQPGNANYNAASAESEDLVIAKASQTITFGTLSSKTFGDAGFQLGATVTSGLTISYQSSNPAVATIMGSTITIVGAGSTEITASQPGNAAYNAATPVVRSFIVAKANQTITLENISGKKADSAPFTLAATASSGLPVSISSGDAAIATISGNTITVAGAGQTLILATQAGDANYNAAPVATRVLTVGPVVVASAGQGEMWGIAAGGDNGLGVIYKTNSTGSAYAVKYHFSVSGNGALQPRGRLTIAANGKLYGFAGSGPPPVGGVLFEFDPVTNTYTKKIDLPPGSGRPGRGLVAAPNGKLYGIQVAMGNGNSVIFEYNPENNAYTAKHTFIAPVPPNIPPGDLTYLNGKLYGSTQAGGAFSGGFLFEFDLSTETFTKHADLSGVTGTIQRGPMVLAPNGKLYGVMAQGGSTANAGTIFEFDPVTNALVKRRDLEVSSGRGANGLTLALNGKFYATAIGGGSIGEGTLFEYDPIANTITKKVDFTLMTGCNPMAPLELGSNGKLYGTTSRGGVTSSYTTLFEFDPITGVTSIKKEFPLTAGVTVSEPLTFRNTIISDQAISFPDLGTREFGTLIELNATSSSGLPITYTSEDPSIASVTGSTVTLKTLGTTNIIASQSGNNLYTPAPEVMRTLTIVKGKQVITFEQLADRTLGGPKFTLTATTSSGLPIVFHTGGDKVSIANNEATILKAGLASISATQSGNSFFEPAQSVVRVFCVNPSRPTINFTSSSTSLTVSLTSSSPVGNQWFFNNIILVGQTGATLMTSEPGLYKVQASVEGCISEMSNNFALIVTSATIPPSDLKLQMYPNPVSNELHIVWPADTEGSPREVAVFDLLGRQLNREIMSDDEVRLDVRSLKSGAYVVRASRGAMVVQQRFLKE